MPPPRPAPFGGTDRKDHDGIRLRLRVRRRTPLPSHNPETRAPYNAFVRLPRSAVHQLVVLSRQGSHDGFAPFRGGADSEVDFLPLRIQFESTGDVVYGSYNGGELVCGRSLGKRKKEESAPVVPSRLLP
jgi:hypothetical protein